MPKSNWQDFVFGFGNPITKHGRKRLKNLFEGDPETVESNLLPEQQSLFEQQQAAAQGKGAGGAFGNAADYYYNNLSDDPETLKMLSAPELRNYNENIIPGLSEQFAGMGSGGLSSSGFRNAAVNAGTDLSERLGAIRANLRENAARGLMNLGEQGLQDRKIIRPGTPGLLQSLAPVAGTVAGAAIGGAIGGPGGAVAGAGVGGNLGNSFSGQNVGKNTFSYGQQRNLKSPLAPNGVPGNMPSSNNGFNLPQFGAR